MNRDVLLKLTRIINYVTAALIVVLLASFALPYFNYPGTGEETVDVISIWTYMGFPAKFVQMEELLDLKFITIKQLNVVVALIVAGIVSLITLLTKKGLATQIFPLIWAVWGLVGYLTNSFLKLGNTFARPVQIVIIAITLVVILANIVLYIMELKSRSDSDFMDLDAWSV